MNRKEDSKCSQGKSSKEAEADSSIRRYAMAGVRDGNRSYCCSSWTEKLEILRCLIQTNVTGLLLGFTFNNSTATFQLLPIHKELQN